MNGPNVYVMLAGKWVCAEWDKWHVGCYINGVWFNMASFEAYCHD